MKRKDLSIWAILIAASVVGSLVAAAIPNQDPKAADKQVEHSPEHQSDETYAWANDRSQPNSDVPRGQSLAAAKSF